MGGYKTKDQPLTEKDVKGIAANLENGELTMTQAYAACRKLLKEVHRLRAFFKEEVKPPEASQCSHVNRVQLMDPEITGIRVGGAVSIGQCERQALPHMVYCEVHCDREAMAMVIKRLSKNLDKLGA